MQHSGSVLPEEEHSSFKEMMCGLLLGFFLGVLCLFWFKESVFTRRHQIGNYYMPLLLHAYNINHFHIKKGILAGMAINVSCGVIHVYS